VSSWEQRPIALVGLMGAGKSSVARILGERLRVPIADTDAIIEAEEGCTITEFFDRDGEERFRRCESDVFARSVGSGVGVVACGGGIVLDPANRAILSSRCRVAWLKVSPDEAARRLAGDDATRPLLRGVPPGERLGAVLEKRLALYAEVADVQVPTGARSPDDVASAVLEALGALER
jgi:shikimate kinase